MRWLEVATEKNAIARLLARHDLAEPPPPHPRAPPVGQLPLPLALA
jgi:hypothetical protein